MSEPVIEGTSLKALALDLTTLDGHISSEIKNKAHSITEINLSFNELTATSLPTLSLFGNAVTLVLDNNNFSSLTGFPPLPKLQTLWLNNNSIEDIEEVVSVLPHKCPQLAYLSLLRNPCCPNELMGKGTVEYRRYRLYVRYRIATLRTLDATPYTAEDIAEAREKGRFLQTKAAPASEVSLPLSGNATPAATGASPSTPTDSNAKTLPLVNNGFVTIGQSFFKDDELQAKSLSSRCEGPYYFPQRHFYSGKASEGNRFIRDNVL